MFFLRPITYVESLSDFIDSDEEYNVQSRTTPKRRQSVATPRSKRYKVSWKNFMEKESTELHRETALLSLYTAPHRESALHLIGPSSQIHRVP